MDRNVVGIPYFLRRKRKCPRERARVLLSRAYSRSSLCKQNNLHVNNLYTISALKYVTRLGKSKTKNVEKMYVLNLPKGVRKLFPRNLTLIIAMSKTLISLEILACVAAGPRTRTRLNHLYSLYRRFRVSATQARKSLQSLTLPFRTPDERNLKVFCFATSPFQKHKGKYLTVVGQNRC